MTITNNNILIVTGLSGAGMSSSLKHLEDLGYEVFDNFPLSLIDALINDSVISEQPIAIGIDSRSRGFDPEQIRKKAKQTGARLVFITADEVILLKRFTETRRRHPLAKDRPTSAGIKKEQEWLYSLRASADSVIDTSQLSIHDLRRTLEGYFGLENTGKLTITLISFGFRYGLPREADIVMDARFLRNPHWDANLKAMTGQDMEVGTYIEEDENFGPFIARFKDLVELLLPRYSHEGKSYLTLAIGCTGGKHRSVYTVQTLKPWFEEKGFTPHILHRDIDR